MCGWLNLQPYFYLKSHWLFFLIWKSTFLFDPKCQCLLSTVFCPLSSQGWPQRRACVYFPESQLQRREGRGDALRPWLPLRGGDQPTFSGVTEKANASHGGCGRPSPSPNNAPKRRAFGKRQRVALLGVLPKSLLDGQSLSHPSQKTFVPLASEN